MSNEITPKENTAVSTQVGSPRGFSANMEMSDLIIPRVELVQALSPCAVDGTRKPGELCDSIEKTLYPQPLEFIPIKLEKNFIRWAPRAEGGGMLWRTNDPNDPRVIEETKFGPNGELPLATTYFNYLCYLRATKQPSVISFSKTSLVAGRKLYTMCAMSGNDIFARVYKLSSVKRSTSKGTFFVFDVEKAGVPTEEEFSLLEGMYNNFSKKELSFDVEKGDAPSKKVSDEF